MRNQGARLPNRLPTKRETLPVSGALGFLEPFESGP
jgi:hypothetical protein